MRKCGDCTLCCKLVPVRSLGKGANERCKHQRHHKGCTVYNTREMPHDCKLWSCRWIVSDDTATLSRPDRSHYVIDLVPDFITAEREGQEVWRLQVVVIWCDPKYPDAHRDPKLREYLERRGQEGIAAMIRYNARDGFVIFPPALSEDGQWHEVRGQSSGKDHTPAELFEFFQGTQIQAAS